MLEKTWQQIFERRVALLVQSTGMRSKTAVQPTI
jgi:hypothetical protein